MQAYLFIDGEWRGVREDHSKIIELLSMEGDSADIGEELEE